MVKYQPKVIRVNSRRTSQRPRVTRKRASSPRVRRVPAIQALAPARKTKVGAQKWVIQRVAKSASVGPGEVGRVEPDLGEVGADVVEHHDDHDQAAEQVHVVEAAAGRWRRALRGRRACREAGRRRTAFRVGAPCSWWLPGRASCEAGIAASTPVRETPDKADMRAAEQNFRTDLLRPIGPGVVVLDDHQHRNA